MATRTNVASDWHMLNEQRQHPVPEQLRLILSKPPQEPVPEHFGLSPDELSGLESTHAARDRKCKSWRRWLFWLFLVATTVVAYLLVVFTNYHLLSLWLAPVLGIIIVPSLLELSREIAERAIPPTPLDPRIQNFRAAQIEYMNSRRAPITIREEAERARKDRERERKQSERKRRTGEIYWRTLDGLSFEREVAALLSSLGHQVKNVGGSGDGGIDLFSDGVPVQCKQHADPQGPAVIRELIGACKVARASRGILITTAGVTAPAKKFAREHNIDVIDAADLARMAAKVPPWYG